MIDTIRLIGCQSWKDTTIKLSSGLTVISAPNNTGKSVLYKMFKLAVSPKYFSASKRKKLIRWGEEQAIMMITFTDGCEGVVVLSHKSLVYGWRENNSENWKYTVEPKKEFIQELGFLVSSDGKFVANIIDADQDLMLVDSNSKGTYEFVDMLCNDNDLEMLRDKVTSAKVFFEPMNRRVLDDITKLRVDLDKMKFQDVAKEEQQLRELNVLDKIAQGLLCVDYDTITIVDDSFKKLEHVAKLLNLPEVPCVVSTYLPEWNRLVELCSMPKLPDIVKENPRDFDALFRLYAIPTLPVLIKEVGKDLEILCKFLEFPDLPAVISDDEIQQLENQLLESGTKFSCGIWGEVIYDGKKCVPIDS